jgi:hypothetical protein
MEVAPMARKKNSAKATDRPPSKDLVEGIRPSDRKVLNAFLSEVETDLWGVSAKDRKKALSDLKEHVLDHYKPHQADHAMELALASVGNPEVLAKGIRTLYGYSTGFKGLLVGFAFMIGLITVPLGNAWTFLGPWPILGLLVTFLFISTFGTQTGYLWGGLIGLSAALSRVVILMALVWGIPDEYTLGTTQSMLDFALVSVFLVLVGLLAGHIREASIKDYFQEEAI